ncbi:MAG: hypothetical protein J6T70_03805 [Bacteroidales bacterium]|nr:hypothetical protein [Bacteroidales bacterium]
MIQFKHILLVFVCIFGFALNGLCGNNGNSPFIPIDGGVSALIAAGVAYGVKKYRDYRVNKKDLDNSSK